MSFRNILSAIILGLMPSIGSWCIEIDMNTCLNAEKCVAYELS